MVAAVLPSALKHKAPLESPANPRTPLWPGDVGVAQYTYDVALVGDCVAVLMPGGTVPGAKDRLYPDFGSRLTSWLSRNVGEFDG